MFEIILLVVTLIADQLTKFIADRSIPYGTAVPVWNGVFEFANVHNSGAAWGMFAGGRWVFIILTVAVCCIIMRYLLREKKNINPLARTALVLILSGAIGNLIDRVAFGYVRDMISFVLINFPVFNVADSCVTVGAGLIILDTLFNGERSLFNQIGSSDKKQEKKEPEDGKTDAP